MARPLLVHHLQLSMPYLITECVTVSSDTLPTMKYSLEEVAKHRSTSSCWIVVHRKVYDITEFLPKVNHKCVSLRR